MVSLHLEVAWDPVRGGGRGHDSSSGRGGGRAAGGGGGGASDKLRAMGLVLLTTGERAAGGDTRCLHTYLYAYLLLKVGKRLLAGMALGCTLTLCT